MAWSSVHVDYAWYTKIFVVFVLTYPWLIVGRVVQGWRRHERLSVSLLYAVALPGFVASAVSWLGFERLVSGVLLADSLNPAIRAAGVAEAATPVLLATGLGTVLSILAYAAFARRRVDQVVQLLPSAGLLIVPGGTCAFGWWLVRASVGEELFTSIWAGVATSALLSLLVAWGVFRARSVETSPASLAALLVANLLTCTATWHFISAHRAIAMGLRGT